MSSASEESLPGVQRPQTVTEMTLEQLRAAIRSGEIAPGSRLRQMETAKRLGVSSTPVREAFAALEREGLVVSTAHKGIVVFEPTLVDLHEAYQIRTLLEVFATEHAVPLMQDADFDDLAGLMAEMEALRGGDPSRFVELNRAFHARIYAVAGMPRLERMISDLRDSSEAYVAMHRSLVRDEAQTNADHAAIADACRRGDTAAAGEATRSHLGHTMDALTRELRTRSADQV